MRNIRPRLTDIPIHLPHHADMLVTVEQRVLVLATARTGTATGATASRPAPGMRRAIRLEAGVGQHDDEALGVLVVRSDGDVLLRDELGELGRRAGLGSWIDRDMKSVSVVFLSCLSLSEVVVGKERKDEERHHHTSMINACYCMYVWMVLTRPLPLRRLRRSIHRHRSFIPFESVRQLPSKQVGTGT